MIEPSSISVLVVDDHPLVRDGISAIVDHQADLKVVGQAASAEEAMVMFDTLAPDVTLVDLGLPEIGGIELITLLHARSPAARFIVLTANAGGGEIAKALHAGADAYLFKNGPSAELLTAIRIVSAGGKYLSNAVGHLANSMAKRPALTTRELEVLVWITRGQSNSQIASGLGVTEDTVKSHVKNVLTKLEARSRTEAAAIGQRLGLISLKGN